MKASLLTVFILASLVVAGYCQGQDGCGKPFELLNCQALVSGASDNFCVQLAKLRKCFVDDAQCKPEFFEEIQKTTEKGLGIKCGACTLSSTTSIVLMLTAATTLVFGRSFITSD